jgi:hypothetical protein
LEQHRTIEVGDATLECTLRGSDAHAGHFMVLEQAEAIAGAVLEFFGVGRVGGYAHLISRAMIIPKRGPAR